ncbi:MAG: TetR/AcrR family transcriptional regulator [Proteobacteria bacterium]|nr:TetR/AcrR family transcriptional regulator [Pseudomonadota bacterium]
MPMSEPNSRESLLTELVDVFRRRGYEGATLNQLAEATSLGKASLYHHFPGGKAQMAELLLVRSLDTLNSTAFSHLHQKNSPGHKLAAFIDGFATYTDQGESHCLVAILGQGSAGEVHRSTIQARFDRWEAELAEVFKDLGLKPKQATRQARRLLAELYGALLLSQLRADPRIFRQVTKRQKNRLILL